MTNKKRPRKVIPPLAYVVLPKKGSTRKVVERLPEMQEDLEAAIVQKFVGAPEVFREAKADSSHKIRPVARFHRERGRYQLENRIN